jgi:hypothetical protein
MSNDFDCRVARTHIHSHNTKRWIPTFDMGSYSHFLFLSKDYTGPLEFHARPIFAQAVTAVKTVVKIKAKFKPKKDEATGDARRATTQTTWSQWSTTPDASRRSRASRLCKTTLISTIAKSRSRTDTVRREDVGYDVEDVRAACEWRDACVPRSS